MTYSEVLDVEGVQELCVRVSVDVYDHVAVLFVAVDDVHEEERLAFGLLLHLLPRLAVHQVDLDLRQQDGGYESLL